MKLSDRIYKCDKCGLTIDRDFNASLNLMNAVNYKVVANSTKLPIILYSVPSRTGVNILPETAIAIAKENPNVVAIKEASGNLDQVRTLGESKALDIYSGNDDQIYDVLNLGGVGVISVLANIFPEETHNIVEEYLNGNTLESLKQQREALELVKALFSDVNPIPVKKAVELEGLCSGLIREPLIELDKEKTLQLTKAINNYRNRKQ